jgi:phosphatidylglycerophosphatase A
MIIAAALVITAVTVIVITACFRATGISIQLNDFNNEDKAHKILDE